MEEIGIIFPGGGVGGGGELCRTQKIVRPKSTQVSLNNTQLARNAFWLVIVSCQ